MNAVDICRQIVNEKACYVIRQRNDTVGEYDAKPWGTGNKKGWVYVDLFTASAIIQVFDALNEENRSKFLTLDITKMAKVAFRLAA